MLNSEANYIHSFLFDNCAIIQSDTEDFYYFSSFGCFAECIAIAKLNHYASAVFSDGKVLLEPFRFTNDNDGFCTLVSILNSFEKNQIIIGLKSTAHYGNNLLIFLVPKDYNVCLINPDQTSTMHKNHIRKTKTEV